MSRAFLSQSTNDLSSTVVINTRPLERAAPLTAHLQNAGFSVVDMPMLTLKPRIVSDADIDLMQDWLSGSYDALVIVSPTAAASGLAVWQALKKTTERSTDDLLSESKTLYPSQPPSHLIAVGEATAAVLQDSKLPFKYQVLQPKVANNEGMLAMPEIERLQAGDKLLIWRGLGGRRLLVDTLKARGVHIDSIAWYERTQPTDAKANYQRWVKQFIDQSTNQSTSQSQQTVQAQVSKPIVIISSGTAFEHWTDIVKQTQSDLDVASKSIILPTLTDFNYVVLGERLANMVAAEQLHYWQVEDLSPTTISAAIKQGRWLAIKQ
ncbi:MULTISPECIES: uroporphyrinogen-III synthase [unclassified Psychrobacter]|uniref:uroporphyrinogen-III synthase n=1 Tax=unclassified Psychrobacter TaxID=196806 RepID=UPI00071E8449|nr:MULTISPECIES: uroporphyrinogen-III synthase [unclassified Psychrobacter]OLF37484.1 uroporphyrinogen III synthase [Psychrobacter sp. Cmf 22.2]